MREKWPTLSWGLCLCRDAGIKCVLKPACGGVRTKCCYTYSKILVSKMWFIIALATLYIGICVNVFPFSVRCGKNKPRRRHREWNVKMSKYILLPTRDLSLNSTSEEFLGLEEEWYIGEGRWSYILIWKGLEVHYLSGNTKWYSLPTYQLTLLILYVD